MKKLMAGCLFLALGAGGALGQSAAPPAAVAPAAPAAAPAPVSPSPTGPSATLSKAPATKTPATHAAPAHRPMMVRPIRRMPVMPRGGARGAATMGGPLRAHPRPAALRARVITGKARASAMHHHAMRPRAVPKRATHKGR